VSSETATEPLCAKGDKQAREERIDRLMEELRESIRRTNFLLDGLRDRGLLPPRVPRRPI
jgi:hypothetical protein